MTFFRKILYKCGFTLFHLVVIIIILSIVAAVAASMIERSVYQLRINRTLKKIQTIQGAIFGEYWLRDQTSFGYVGDMEELPKRLNNLIKNPGGGKSSRWNGPYITPEFLEDESDPFLDAWGNPILYEASTGLLGISSASIGDNKVVIPEPFENVDEILYGGIEGVILDSNGSAPPKGHRRHIHITMAPVFTAAWPDIDIDVEMDKELFHMHRLWPLRRTIREGIDKFNDYLDVDRRHWSGSPAKNYWRWLPDGMPFDINDDSYDDHETEYDSMGIRRYFDPHYEDFWRDYRYSSANIDIYEQITIFIHPDRFGNYSADKIPVKPYIITCYHDYYELSIKQYVVIRSGLNKKLNFRFPVVFDQPDTSASLKQQ